MPRRRVEDLAVTFRVKPNTGRCYFEVLIFKNYPSLRRHAEWLIKKEKRDTMPGRYWAMFLPYEPGPLLGRALFAETKISPGSVAHELNHAAIHWAALRKLRPMDDVNGPDCTQEEKFTWAHHRMVDQFHQQFPVE